MNLPSNLSRDRLQIEFPVRNIQSALTTSIESTLLVQGRLLGNPKLSYELMVYLFPATSGRESQGCEGAVDLTH